MSHPAVRVVREGPIARVVTAPAPRVALSLRGPRGPAGAPGGAGYSRIAASPIGGHRVVRALEDGRVAYASSDDVAHADLILGVTLYAADEGAAVEVRAGGELVESSWSWAPGAVFCGLNGVLTQTAPTSGFIRQIGIADAPDRIVVDLRPPILLE